MYKQHFYELLRSIQEATMLHKSHLGNSKALIDQAHIETIDTLTRLKIRLKTPCAAIT